jgi:hypothetical protein
MDIKEIENKVMKSKNKANLHGLNFEIKTSNLNNLILKKYDKVKISNNKYGWYLSHKHDENEYLYFEQGGLKQFIQKTFNKTLIRNVDEAYLKITPEKKYLIIVEKKFQNCEGSVEEKLLLGSYFKQEYSKILGDDYVVDYVYCVSAFLKNKFVSKLNKYKIILEIFKDNNIKILYGDDENYFNEL